MFKKLLGLGVLIMASQLFTSAYCVNHKLLDMEADACVSKTWTGIPIKKERIKEGLYFLYDTNSVDKKYLEENSFKTFYTKINTDIEDKKLLKFAKDCQEIHKESSDLKIKIAVHLLLERVTEKYTKLLRQLKRAKELDAQRDQELPNKEFDPAVFDAFINADENINIK